MFVQDLASASRLVVRFERQTFSNVRFTLNISNISFEEECKLKGKQKSEKRKEKKRRRKTKKVWRCQESNFIDLILCSRYAEPTNQRNLFKNIFDAYWVHVSILLITCPVIGLSIDQCTSYVLSKSFCCNFGIDRSCSWTHCFFSAILNWRTVGACSHRLPPTTQSLY